MPNLTRRFRAFCSRLAGLLHPGRASEDFTAELESHIAMHVEDGIRTGLSPEQARRQALIRLGGFEQTRQQYRERKTLVWTEYLIRDVRFSLRTLAKHPAVTAIAIFSIGLGIGANATIFSMVSRFLLRPAPVSDPATLMAIYPGHGAGGFSWPLYHDLRDQEKSFSAIAGYFPLVPASIYGSGEPERIWGQAVTGNFFDVTALHMLRGRGFTSSEGHDPVVVLSAALWRRRFQGDSAIVGRTVNLSGHAFTVVGIAPDAFHGADQLLYGQFWVPYDGAGLMVPGSLEKNNRNSTPLWLIGRLQPGATRASAAAELNALARRIAHAYPQTDKDDAFVLEEAGILPPAMQRPILIFLTALTVVVLLLLLIAAFNVANLLFAQTAARQREMAVRLALGATRARLQRQVLMESVLLGLGGGALGILLSIGSTRALSVFRLPIPIPIDMSVHVDTRVLLATFALSILSGILLGAIPAWVAARPLLVNALKGEDALARPARRWTLRNLLTIAQVAMSVVLLSMTGLFLRSLQSAAGIDLGFQPHGLLTISVDPRAHGYSVQRTFDFLRQAQRDIAALPGVTSTSWTDYAPLSLVGDRDTFRAAGHADQGSLNASTYTVTPGYFPTMGIPRITGRDFGEETASSPGVVIVNQAFAERVFGDANPIGQKLVGRKWSYEIIGVTGNAKVDQLDEEVQPVVYRSLEQTIGDEQSFVGYTLLVRTAGNPNNIMEPVRRQIHSLDPSLAVFNEETMDEHIRDAYFLPRVAATLFGVSGGIGLVLATVGLYGVISYSVSQRTREIGIRIAMGAQPWTVERLVLRQGLVLASIALVIGWPAAWMLAKLAGSFLYGIRPHDPLTFVLVPGLLVAVALAACWIPARRAASVDPMQALRAE